MPDPSDGTPEAVLRSDVGPFAILPEWLLDDLELSDRAVRLYAVLARAAGAGRRAWPGRKLLAERLGCSPSAIDRCLRELRQAGALDVAERFTPAGRQTSNAYTIRLVRAADPSPPVTREVVTGEQVPLVTGDQVTTLNEKKKEREVRPTASPRTSPAVTTPVDASDFERWWSIYPRKVGKRAAAAAYSRACRRANALVLLAGATRYRDDPNRRDAFTAHPTTWLNRDGWADEPEPRRTDSGFAPYVNPDAGAYADVDRPLADPKEPTP